MKYDENIDSNLDKNAALAEAQLVFEFLAREFREAFPSNFEVQGYPDVDDLPMMFPKEVSSKEIPLGLFQGKEYVVKVVMSKAKGESKQNKHENPDYMFLTPLTKLSLVLKSKDSRIGESVRVTCDFFNYADQGTWGDPVITCNIPSVHSQQINQIGALSITVDMPGMTMPHIVQLEKIINSDDPDLGLYGLNQVISLAQFATDKLKLSQANALASQFVDRYKSVLK